jgi:hypothetical protein
MGWIVVSLVGESRQYTGNVIEHELRRVHLGFVTALVAYLVIKIEAYSFDLKSGFCSVQPWGFKSEKNCAPGGWVEWEDVEWGWMIWLRGLYGGDNAGEIVVYFLIAVSVALDSSETTASRLIVMLRFADGPGSVLFGIDDLLDGLYAIRDDSRRNVCTTTEIQTG